MFSSFQRTLSTDSVDLNNEEKSSGSSIRDLFRFKKKKKKKPRIPSLGAFSLGLKRTYSIEKDMIRQNLIRSIQEKDYVALRKSVQDAHRTGVDRIEEVYEQAIQVLARHDHLLTMQEIATRTLRNAIEEADRQLLKSAIVQAKDTQLVPESCEELREATQLLNRLEIGSRLFRIHKAQSFDRSKAQTRVVNKMKDALRFMNKDDDNDDKLITFGTLLQEAKQLSLPEDHETVVEMTQKYSILKLRARRVSETLRLLRKAKTKEELQHALARAHAFKMKSSTVGEVRAAKKLLHELEERDARIREASDDLEESLKLGIADALHASIERVRGKIVEIDLKVYELELEKLREVERQKETIETKLRDAITMRSLLEIRRAVKIAVDFGECDVELMRQANEFVSVLEKERQEQEFALQGLRDAGTNLEKLRVAVQAVHECFEFEELKSNVDFRKAQDKIHELEVEEQRCEAAKKELRDAIEENPPNHERLRHAICVAKEARLSTTCELMRQCETMFTRIEKDRENADRAIRMLCDALKLKSFDVRFSLSCFGFEILNSLYF
jgi:hypothetical protein